MKGITRDILLDLAKQPDITLTEFASGTRRAADVILSELKLDVKLIAEARRKLAEGSLGLDNAYSLAKLDVADQRAHLTDATLMKSAEFAPKVQMHLKKMKRDRIEETVLVVVVDRFSDAKFIKLELAGAELERVLDMHGTNMRISEMSAREQLVHNYFFTEKGRHRHKHTTKRISAKTDHAIIVYYDRS